MTSTSQTVHEATVGLVLAAMEKVDPGAYWTNWAPVDGRTSWTPSLQVSSEVHRQVRSAR